MSEEDCGCGEPQGWVPLNSKFQIDTETKLTVQVPPGWGYIGRKTPGNTVVKIPGGANVSISCECTGSGQCKPFLATGKKGTTWGCGGQCTVCLQTSSGIIAGEVTVFSRGGFIDFSDNTRFLEENISIPAVFPEMLELKEVEKSLKEFMDNVYRGLPFPKFEVGENFISAPAGYLFVPISLFGRAAMIPVPKMAAPTYWSEQSRKAGGASKVSCSCDNGNCSSSSGGVPGIGSVIYCEGDCKGKCTLTSRLIVDNGDELVLYTSDSYKF